MGRETSDIRQPHDTLFLEIVPITYQCSSALCTVNSLPGRYTRVYPLQGLYFQQVPRCHSPVLGTLCEIISHSGSDVSLAGNFFTLRYFMPEPRIEKGGLCSPQIAEKRLLYTLQERLRLWLVRDPKACKDVHIPNTICPIWIETAVHAMKSGRVARFQRSRQGREKLGSR